MEARTLPSVSALFVSGELHVVSDDADAIQVSVDANGRMLVESADVVVDPTTKLPSASGSFRPLNNLPNVFASEVTSLIIEGSDQENILDVSALTAAAFASGLTIEIDGQNGDDIILGSDSFGEVIRGDDGQDTINSGAGADIIDAGDGDDSITSGTGDDTVDGGDGNDFLDGGDGNDSQIGGDGDDTLHAGNGDDIVSANNGQDSVFGEAGNDTLNGDGGIDTVSGGDDNDSILGGEFNDFLQGDAGNDTINGQAGRDSIDGGDGDDSLIGGVGHDTLNGDAGNDVLNGSAGHDLLSGDDGNDRILGGGGNDIANGGNGDDSIFGNAGTDSLDGENGTDFVDGGEGNDHIRGNFVGISVSDTTVVEGDIGETATAVFLVTLSEPSNRNITLDYFTDDAELHEIVDPTTTGTARLIDNDYERATSTDPNRGRLTIPAGATEARISVTVNGDNCAELDEQFHLHIVDPFDGSQSNVILVDQSAMGTILDDGDVIGRVSITDFTLREGDPNTPQNDVRFAEFTVSLADVNRNADVTVSYSTADSLQPSSGIFQPTTGTLDYTPANGLTVTIPRNSISAVISIPIVDDTTSETDEEFLVNLSQVPNGNATVIRGTAFGRIINDDRVRMPGAFVIPEGSTNEIDRIDPSTGAEVDSRLVIPASANIQLRPNGRNGIAFDGDFIYVVGPDTAGPGFRLLQIDTRTTPALIVQNDVITDTGISPEGLAALVNGAVNGNANTTLYMLDANND